MHPRRRFFLSVLVLLLVLAILEPADIPFYSGFVPATLLPDWAVTVLSIVWWYALGWSINSGLELFLWRRLFGGAGGMPRQRKLLTDLLAIAIYATITAIVFGHVLHQPLAGLFATSGLLVIILGFALQNTLADMFAGLVLNIERPYKAGDWITLDGGTQGLVLVTNWRATHLRTRTGDTLVVPNSLLAKSRLTNHAVPTKLHLANIELPLAYGFDESRIEALLKQAAASVDGVLGEPAPIILLHEMTGSVVVWRVYFFIDDFARLVVLRGLVARAVYAALRGSEMSAFLPRNEVWLQQEGAAARIMAPSA
jgi:small-conductance mechanosensitive channel